MWGASFTLEFPLQCTGSLGSVRSVNAIRALRLRAARLQLPGTDGAPLEARLHRRAVARGDLRPGPPATAASGAGETVDLDAEPMQGYRARLTNAVADDLATPKARRAARDFVTSDALRELGALGVEVRDTASGQETTVPRT